MGRRLPLQDIEQIVRGMAATSGISVHRLRPDERAEYRQMLEKAILDKGVKVIIANKECRDYPPSHGAQGAAEPDPRVWLPATAGVYEHHARGVRELPGMHEADGMPGAVAD